MWSNSYIQDYKSCPLSAYLKYDTGLVKINEEASEHHLTYGRGMHEALKKIYLKDTLESAKKSFLEIYSKQLDTNDNAKTRENGLTVLDAYVRHYASDFDKFKILSCEEKEHFDYANEENFTVILDLVLENKEYGGIYGMDHKIVGGKKATLNEEFWIQFDPNSQITKYTSFIISKYGECSGFYVNGIGMGHRQRAYKGEPAGFHYRFRREMFNRNTSQLEIESRDTEYWIGRIKESKERHIWGMNTGACRWCSFRQICKAGWTWPEDKELILINYNQVDPREIEKEIANASTGILPEQTENKSTSSC
jgi:CRISPR/Cas system-associated exonuclease Cas4 (RecB family)